MTLLAGLRGLLGPGTISLPSHEDPALCSQRVWVEESLATLQARAPGRVCREVTYGNDVKLMWRCLHCDACVDGAVADKSGACVATPAGVRAARQHAASLAQRTLPDAQFSVRDVLSRLANSPELLVDHRGEHTLTIAPAACETQAWVPSTTEAKQSLDRASRALAVQRIGSCAVVTGSASLRGSGYGDAIERHIAIFRPLGVPSGRNGDVYAADVGWRTSAWYGRTPGNALDADLGTIVFATDEYAYMSGASGCELASMDAAAQRAEGAQLFVHGAVMATAAQEMPVCGSEYVGDARVHPGPSDDWYMIVTAVLACQHVSVFCADNDAFGSNQYWSSDDHSRRRYYPDSIGGIQHRRGIDASDDDDDDDADNGDNDDDDGDDDYLLQQRLRLADVYSSHFWYLISPSEAWKQPTCAWAERGWIQALRQAKLIQYFCGDDVTKFRDDEPYGLSKLSRDETAGETLYLPSEQWP